MKTIEIIRYTGEMETVTVNKGTPEESITEVPITEIAKEYTCEDGEENSLLSRARLTAELYSRDREGEFKARIQA